MNRETSIYLDFVRFAAALVVMASHLGEQSWTGGLGWQFLPFGAPAVDVFFVLSGYIIAYTVTVREHDFPTYAVNRAARLYSVVIPVLLIAALLALIGQLVRPDLLWGAGSIVPSIQSALFINEIWFSAVQPVNNSPFWSLGYEAWYYIIFAAAVFSPDRFRVLVTGICLLLAGPRIGLMFPVWLIGVAAFNFVRRKAPWRWTGAVLWAATGGALAGLAIWQAHERLACGQECWLPPAHIRSASDWREYAVDYGLGLLVALNFIGFHASASLWKTPMAWISQPIRWLAGATFTLYLLHYPVAKFLSAVSPWPLGSWPQRALVYGGTLAVVFAVAEVTERRKRAWQAAIWWLVGRASRYVPLPPRQAPP